MFHAKFLLLTVFVFATQGFAAEKSCVDLSGEYQCPLSEDGKTFGLSIQQSVNSDNAPVMSMEITADNTTLQPFEYIADNQIHTNYLASCRETHFGVISPYNDTYFQITTHYLTPEGELAIEKHLAAVQMDGDKAKEFQIIQKLGVIHCTKD